MMIDLNELISRTGYHDNSYHEFLKSLIKEENPKSILEVGTFLGSSLITMGLAASDKCKLIGIDNTTYPELYDNLDKIGLDATILHGEDYELIPSVRAEFVHYDADHSVVGTFRALQTISEWENLPKTIVLHDWIDPYVQWGVKCFMLTARKLYDPTVHEDVFNQCVVLRRKS